MKCFLSHSLAFSIHYSLSFSFILFHSFTFILYSLSTFILFHSFTFILYSLKAINKESELSTFVSLLLILEICGNNSYNLYTFTLLFSDQPGGIHYHKSQKIGNIRKSHCWDWRAVSNWLGDSGMDHSECHSRIPHTDELTHKVAVWV